MASEISRRERLEILRDQLTARLADAEHGQAAALSRELRATMAELDSLPKPGQKSKRDELKERRAARKATASAEPRARSGQ